MTTNSMTKALAAIGLTTDDVPAPVLAQLELAAAEKGPRPDPRELAARISGGLDPTTPTRDTTDPARLAEGLPRY